MWQLCEDNQWLQTFDHNWWSQICDHNQWLQWNKKKVGAVKRHFEKKKLIWKTFFIKKHSLLVPYNEYSLNSIQTKPCLVWFGYLYLRRCRLTADKHYSSLRQLMIFARSSGGGLTTFGFIVDVTDTWHRFLGHKGQGGKVRNTYKIYYGCSFFSDWHKPL